MTQPAKSQEPSMEEILASIRRIIADDDANKTAPAAAGAAEGRAAPSPPPPMFSRAAAGTAAAASAASTFEPLPRDWSRRPSAAAADQSSDILDLTESMAASMPPPPPPPPSAMSGPAAQFRTIDGSSDVGFDEAERKVPAPRRERGASDFRRNQRGGRFRLQYACPDRADAERPHAGRSGARNAPPDAEILARRQSARHGRAPGARRDRTRLARADELN